MNKSGPQKNRNSVNQTDRLTRKNAAESFVFPATIVAGKTVPNRLKITKLKSIEAKEIATKNDPYS